MSVEDINMRMKYKILEDNEEYLVSGLLHAAGMLHIVYKYKYINNQIKC